MLAVENLVVGYGGEPIVRDVSLQVADGSLVAVLGPNGAGKSTLMKALLGELRVLSGHIRVDGNDFTSIAPYHRIVRGLGYVPQVGRVFSGMTVRENLEMGAYHVRGSLTARYARVFALFPDLEKDSRRKAGLLSGGQQAMLGIGRALMTEPRVLLLDEPTAGMSPFYVDRLWETVRGIGQLGVAVLVVEQNVARALADCDRAYVLSEGKVAANDSCSELVGRKDIEGLFVG